MKIKLFMEPYEISHYGVNGSEEYIFIDKAQYPDIPFLNKMVYWIYM
ncbi:hypothetical protein [Lacrimispora aerotolerans]